MAPTVYCGPGKVFLNDGPRCCNDITCPPGHQPVRCSMTNASSSCEECPEGTYNPDITRLSAGDTCEIKNPCEGPHMSVRDIGSKIVDAKCKCDQGYHLSDDEYHCFRNEPCPPGQGQDGHGGCINCKTGWFSDKNDEDQVCEQLNKCEGKCLLQLGTRTMDSVCGPKVFGGCSSIREVDITTTTLSPQTISTQISSSPSPRPDNSMALTGSTLGITLPISIILIFCCYVKRRRNKKKLAQQPGYVNIINNNQPYIVDNLNPRDILDELLQRLVINDEDYLDVQSQRTEYAQTRCLLKIVKRRGEQNQFNFFEVLHDNEMTRHLYDHIFTPTTSHNDVETINNNAAPLLETISNGEANVHKKKQKDQNVIYHPIGHKEIIQEEQNGIVNHKETQL